MTTTGIFDITAYLEIYTRAQALQQQLHDSPPHDPAAYGALVTQVATLWQDAANLLRGGNNGTITAEQIAKTRDWYELGGHRSKPLPEAGSAGQFPYGQVLHWRPLTMDEAKFIKAGDRSFTSTSGGESWLVVAKDSPDPDQSLWRLESIFP